MRIGVVGAGAIGGLYGGVLARAGHQVSFLARGEQLRAIQSRGLKIESPTFGSFVVQATASDNPADLGEAELVLFAVKTYDLDQAVLAARQMLAADGSLLTFQNGLEAPDRVAEIVGPDGAVRTLDAPDLEYAYRASLLKRGALGPVVVRSARLRVHREEAAVATGRILTYQNQRTASQPRQLSAGSIFANPPGDYAGRLIEAVGLKGERRGGAEISAQHANFIVNTGSASAADVLGLIRLAQDEVWEHSGVWLQPEVQLVGSWDPELVAKLAGPARQAAS
jgi:hypothetical protein